MTTTTKEPCAEDISAFYDVFAQKLQKDGLNTRHWAIYEWLKSTKQFRHSKRILEVGCGTGLVTWQIAKIAKNAEILGVDISPQCIENAKKNLKKHESRTNFEVWDMDTFKSDVKFDAAVLPDVIEHIPLHMHEKLFSVLNENLAPGGKIYIHVPDRHYQEHVREVRPQDMQIVDQSISTSEIEKSLEGTELEIVHLERYSVWHGPVEYRRYIIEKEPGSFPVKKLPYGLVGGVKEVLRRTLFNKLA